MFWIALAISAAAVTTPVSTCSIDSPRSPVLTIAESSQESELIQDLTADCSIDLAKAQRIFAETKSAGIGDRENPADGVHVVWLHGYPEEVGWNAAGQKDGLFLKFDATGTVTYAACFKGGVMQEETIFDGGRVHYRMTYKNGKRDECIYGPAMLAGTGYSSAVEKYYGDGRVAWTTYTSKYTGDHWQEIGAFHF